MRRWGVIALSRLIHLEVLVSGGLLSHARSVSLVSWRTRCFVLDVRVHLLVVIKNLSHVAAVIFRIIIAYAAELRCISAFWWLLKSSFVLTEVRRLSSNRVVVAEVRCAFSDVTECWSLLCIVVCSCCSFGSPLMLNPRALGMPYTLSPGATMLPAILSYYSKFLRTYIYFSIFLFWALFSRSMFV